MILAINAGKADTMSVPAGENNQVTGDEEQSISFKNRTMDAGLCRYTGRRLNTTLKF